MVEELIDKIVQSGTNADMKKLEEVVKSVFSKLKMHDNECYSKYVMKLYTLAYGKVLSKEMAEKIIKNMSPYGMHWTCAETSQVQREYGMTNIRDVDFWLVMNMAYNDYHDLYKDDIEMYVKYTQLFLNDEDAKDGKVFIYFTEIPEKIIDMD